MALVPAKHNDAQKARARPERHIVLEEVDSALGFTVRLVLPHALRPYPRQGLTQRLGYHGVTMGVPMDGFARERKFVVDQVRGVQVEGMNTHVKGQESYKCGYWVTKKKETPFVEHASYLHSLNDYVVVWFFLYSEQLHFFYTLRVLFERA